MTNWLSSDLLAQEVHGVIGAATVFGLWLLAPIEWIRELGIITLVVIVLVKESYWDPKNETNQPFIPEGLKDFSFYIVGILIAFAIVYARFRML